MSAHNRLSPRRRFVLRRGVFPWGLLAGFTAAGMAAYWAGDDAHALSTLRTIILCIGCFALWTALIGWTIGSILWELRPTGTASPYTKEPRRRER